jgi:hypothetical protein
VWPTSPGPSYGLAVFAHYFRLVLAPRVSWMGFSGLRMCSRKISTGITWRDIPRWYHMFSPAPAYDGHFDAFAMPLCSAQQHDLLLRDRAIQSEVIFSLRPFSCAWRSWSLPTRNQSWMTSFFMKSKLDIPSDICTMKSTKGLYECNFLDQNENMKEN